MSRWETTSTLEADVEPSTIWERAYFDVAAWPRWNAEIKSATIDGPLSAGATARIVFRTGLRLRFHVVEYEEGRLFTDEARLFGARMGHRHLVEPRDGGGSRLANTIYIEGALAPLWRRILGPAAKKALPDAQRAVVEQTRALDRAEALRSEREASRADADRHDVKAEERVWEGVLGDGLEDPS